MNDVMSPAPGDELIGKMMGQYQIIEEIGRGGMATVYRANQQSMNRNVAIKVLPRQMLHDPGFYDRFLREVEVISQLEHPHILPIYDYGQSDGLPFIAMRYLGGGSLDQRIRRGAMAINEIEKPLRQVAQALDYAHAQDIVHRDLKPGNIMLDEAGNAYLSDFGIARVIGSELTGSMIIGTPAYMSPEQANGLPIDARSDVYALGIVLFELITGQGPFQAETPMAVLLKHITEPLPAISKYRAGVPELVEKVVQIATAKEPDQRFKTAGDLAEAYAAALRDETTDHYPPLNKSRPGTPPSIAIPTAAMMDDTVAVEKPASKPQSSRRNMILVSVAALFTLLMAGLALLTTLDDGGDRAPVVPTPFPRASTISGEGYTISMFNDWIPPLDRIDESRADRLRHVWRAPDRTAVIALTIFDADVNPAGVSLMGMVSTYISEAFGDRFVADHLIDSDVAEDGTIRRSYRVPPLDSESGPIDGLIDIESPGQVDVFFVERDGRFVVITIYTADSVGNALTPRLQSIVDSLRLNFDA